MRVCDLCLGTNGGAMECNIDLRIVNLDGSDYGRMDLCLDCRQSLTRVFKAEIEKLRRKAEDQRHA